MRTTIKGRWGSSRPRYALAVLFAALSLAACGGVSNSGISPRYSLSGVITAAANSAVDSDVNDDKAAYTDNSTFFDAQPIANPVVLGGYVNIAGCGPQGRSWQNGDAEDYFLINLQAGQTVTLLVAQAVSVNLQCGTNLLSLSLYRQIDVENGNTTPLQTVSARSDAAASITVPTVDNYILEVRAVRGASNYVLTSGLAAPAAAPLARDFVPGEVLARFKEAPAGSPSLTALRIRARALGMEVVSGGANGPVLLRLGQGDNPLSSLGVTQRPVAADALHQRQVDTLLAVQALRRRADVISADLNYLRRPLALPDDRFFDRQWDARQINLPNAWDKTKGAANVTVAVLDSGVLPGHPDLQGKLVAGYDFISDPRNAMDGDGIDPDPTDPGDHALGGKSTFHGTHVTGIVAAATDNAVGVAGDGWQTKVMPLRVLGKVGGTSADICQALRYASGLDNDSGTVPARRADIVNMSFGGLGFSQTEQDCVSSARNAGVILVAAAGNNGDSTPEYPASYTGVVSVNAVTLSRERASYSNYGPDIAVAAPGGDLSSDLNGDGYPDGVLSTLGDDSTGPVVYTYGYYAGTSMAAPHVAAVAALMKAVDPALTPLQFDDMLNSGQLTDDLGVAGRDDQFGQGLINAYKAVSAAAAAAGGGAGLSPLLAVSPPALNLGLAQPAGRLTVSNAGGPGLSVTAPTEDSGGWLSLAPLTVDRNGVGSYALTVDRSGMAAGTYTARVSFTSNGGDVAVPVIMQVPDVNTTLTADAGHLYVLLVDPATGKTVETVMATRSGGLYQYSFSQRKGDYQVVAGTDMNNDGYICDTGEACGAYTTVDLPFTITVDGNQSGKDFEAGFFSYLNATAAGTARVGRAYSVTPGGTAR